jgi:hypothetical protein
VADGLLDQASNGKYLVQRPIFSGAKGNKPANQEAGLDH